MKPNYVYWNPWHGCTKISPGCKYCYVYRQDAMYGSDLNSSEAHRNATFDVPRRRRRDGSWYLPSGSLVFTCFTSDFLLSDADEWRKEAWAMMRMRRDLLFYFFTKRIDRLADVLPDDWGEGYDNVIVGCTVENQAMVDYRLPIFASLPIRYKSIIAAPLLEEINISAFLNPSIFQVAVSGESGQEVRVCHYDWILSLRSQCISADVSFTFHHTGARLLKDGVLYRIPRSQQIKQAHKADINYKTDEFDMPEGVMWTPKATPGLEPLLFE